MNSPRWLPRSAFAVAAVCLLASLATGTAPAAAEESGREPATETVPATDTPSGRGDQSDTVPEDTSHEVPFDPAVIRDVIDQQGSARVIVELAVDVEVEAGLDSTEVREQRREIAATRNDVVAQLDGDADVVHAYRTVPAVAMEVDADALKSLRASSEVRSVMLDVPVPPALDYSGPAIEADVARAAGADGDGIAVAILDTGVESSHPLFGGRVVAEACYSTTYAYYGSESFCPGGVWGVTGAGAGADCPATGPSAVSGCGHGTHVAGIAAGGNMLISSGGYSGKTISGVAPKADIIAVQVFSKFPASQCGDGATSPCALSYNSDQIAALEYVYGLRNTYDIAAINMSLGGGAYSATCNEDSAIETAIANLKAAGIATVIATGNNGYTGYIASPACTAGAVAVGSTFAVGAPSYVSSFSNTDANLTDLYAPGSGILSSYVGGTYARLSGTSMATPQVTGVFAALREQAPDATVDEIVAALKSTGVPVSQRRPGAWPGEAWSPAVSAYYPALGFSVPEVRINQARLKLVSNAWKITVSGTGRGAVASDSYSCTSTCWVPVNSGTSVTLTATADSGSTFAGWSGGGCSGTGNCTVSPGAATEVTATFTRVSNDSFATATTIELGPSDTVLLVDTSGATLEAGEFVSCTVDGSASVWFKYVAPVSGTVNLTSRNSNYPVIMKVSTGTSIASLSAITCDDGSLTWSDGYNNWSQLYTNATLSFTAAADTTYMIQVGGEKGATGLLKLTFDGPATADAPAKPTLSVSGSGEVTVSGTAPAGNGNAITGYSARCVNGSSTVTASGATASVEVTGLTPEVSYDCSLRAQTAVGWSPWSRPSIVTVEGVPAAPAAPSVETSVGSVSVSYSVPAARGSAILGYEARCSASGKTTRTSSGSGTSLTVSDLENKTTYDCSVRAENGYGWSEWSASSPAVMPNVPATPSTPSVETSMGSVSVSYSVPAARGSAILGYEARCSASGKTTKTATGGGTTISLSGLDNQVTYDCSVRAENAVGWSEWSGSSPAVMPNVPATPAAPSVSSSVASIAVAGAAPAPRGSTITLYEVSCTAPGAATVTVSGPSPSLSATGLLPGRTYACKIRALNGVGWSGWSAAGSVTTPNTPSTPAAPRLAALRASARVTVTAPAANGATITAYQISCKRSGAAARVVTVAATSVVVTKLTSTKRHACTVRAQNAVGWSAWSPAANVTPR